MQWPFVLFKKLNYDLILFYLSLYCYKAEDSVLTLYEPGLR